MGGGGGKLPLAENSALQSIIQLFASYTVTLSELTNGKFLHTPLSRSALLHSLITARTLNATFVPLYSQRGFSFITLLRLPLRTRLSRPQHKSKVDADLITIRRQITSVNGVSHAILSARLACCRNANAQRLKSPFWKQNERRKKRKTTKKTPTT